MKSQTEILTGLIEFLETSPTPFHATANLKNIFIKNGFTELSETEKWNLQNHSKYFVTRNDSSITAFQMAAQNPVDTGFRLMGAHTDSPNLRVKPQADIKVKDYHQVAVELYGGILLSTWFDRDLSLAGRVCYADKTGQCKSTLIDFKKPLAVIPNLAIHLNREVNENRKISKQTELNPILAHFHEGGTLVNLLKNHLPEAPEILDFELSFYDTQKPALIGTNQEFITSARLDNLLSCYINAIAFIESKNTNTLYIANDHEEVGSASTSGAQGTFLKDVLSRLVQGNEDFIRMCQKSFFLSTDNSHGVHPNYPEKHDALHGPTLNKGPVIKTNTNQRYATNSDTGGFLMALSHKTDVPLQRFVSRNDMPCGSTIGPLTATALGIPTADLGLPTFAMHSIRETAGTKDPHLLYKFLVGYCS